MALIKAGVKVGERAIIDGKCFKRVSAKEIKDKFVETKEAYEDNIIILQRNDDKDVEYIKHFNSLHGANKYISIYSRANREIKYELNVDGFNAYIKKGQI
ncbi:hypothetical protein D3C76_1542200 [compost metagenome]